MPKITGYRMQYRGNGVFQKPVYRVKVHSVGKWTACVGGQRFVRIPMMANAEKWRQISTGRTIIFPPCEDYPDERSELIANTFLMFARSRTL